jgi:Lipid desaturase domain
VFRGDLRALRRETSELPRIPGPLGEPPDVEDLAPMSRNGLVVHSLGAALNGVALFVTAAFLVQHAEMLVDGWPLVLLAIAVATFLADFVSGLLHWAFDTWFSADPKPLRRMVFVVREHHLRPARIFRYRLRDEAGMLSWFGLLLSAPFLAFALIPAGEPGPVRVAAAVAGVTASLEIVLMLEFHKCGHRIRRGRLIRALQRMHLLLSPEQHLRHHTGEHDVNYCLITGVADRTVGRLGVFRLLERCITGLTGAVPRVDDVEWARRYGRPR